MLDVKVLQHGDISNTEPAKSWRNVLLSTSFPWRSRAWEGEGTYVFRKQQKVYWKEARPADKTIDVMFQSLEKGFWKWTWYVSKGSSIWWHKEKEEKDAEKNTDQALMLSAFSFKRKNQIPSDWEANVYPWLKTETNKRNPILRCKCQM